MKRKRKKRVNKKKNKGKEILINIGPVEKRVAILDNGELVDFFMEREGLENYAGSIYKGRVVSVLPGMEASFVDIGREKNGFLHVSDVLNRNAVLKEMLPDEDETSFRPSKRSSRKKIEDILKKGSEIVAQVVKEAMGTKGPRLTTFISLPGRYIVLTPYDPGVGVSRKITDKDERKRIKDIVGDVSNKQKVGCIVRTAAENRSEKDLKGEYKYLMNLWEKIKNRVDKNKAPSLVYEEYGIVLRIVRDVFTDDYTSLIIDSREEYQRIMRFLSSFRPELRKKIKLYSARTPLFQKHDLEKKINQIFERKVSLPSGGYLIIEQTEGVVVIDVNTGSYVGRKSLEQTAFKTNIEAAEEIPRQLMLRDVGGIVIMDFIDMDRKEHSDKVYRVLQDSLKNDKARVSIRGMSQFGIVEMTRQRMRKSLEWSSHIECPYCGGKGMIKSPETIAIEAARKIGRVLSGEKKKRKKLTVYVHPDINHEMLSDQARVLSDIQRKYRCNIDLIQDNSLHIEDIVIEEA